MDVYNKTTASKHYNAMCGGSSLHTYAAGTNQQNQNAQKSKKRRRHGGQQQHTVATGYHQPQPASAAEMAASNNDLFDLRTVHSE